MVYVLNIQGKPLMPCTESKARKLLRDDLAKVFGDEEEEEEIDPEIKRLFGLVK